MSSGIERLREHVTECDECDREPLPVDRVDALLESSRPDIDASTLSRNAFAAARSVLETAAVRSFRRQVAAAVVVALLPLPLIVAYDALLLRLLHAAASSVFSGTMAAYIVFTYVSSLLFLFAVSYAAIPLLMARGRLPRLSAQG